MRCNCAPVNHAIPGYGNGMPERKMTATASLATRA
eukprot:CAMPEP_0177795302 /NCGR_PEP_ID=MMETSP0491_2-20121128/26157_1 /TAXON_ID=63592 /ORGANISM="Tetraselmis chuii, Strain PLY429" /LENGTH=34 /DNA_ID= /DNA_START= /DNA_END= /DNA_ORIENTATION=